MSESGYEARVQRSLFERFPERSTVWRLRTRTVTLGERPLIMGIVNVTPDSFSDGGKFLAADAAIAHGLQLAADGADILDVGGESTRPYASPISAEEEIRRTVEVVRTLSQECDVPVSIDTSKATVATAAIEAGAEIINDITGLEGDAAMVGIARDLGAGVCAMHMQGTPQTMQDDPRYDDIVAEIHEYLRKRRDALLAVGIQRERICLDPGIGFGKTHQHNLTLMANTWRFHDLDCPLLVGHSRKGFIGKLLGDKDADRTSATVGAALSLAAQGVQIIRVHDVKPLRDALSLFQATGGIDGREWQIE